MFISTSEVMGTDRSYSPPLETPLLIPGVAFHDYNPLGRVPVQYPASSELLYNGCCSEISGPPGASEDFEEEAQFDKLFSLRHPRGWVKSLHMSYLFGYLLDLDNID